jgi:hypothetical protein
LKERKKERKKEKIALPKFILFYNGAFDIWEWGSLKGLRFEKTNKPCLFVSESLNSFLI